MFDLITGNVQHAPRHQAASVLVSIAAQVTVAAAILATTLLVIDMPVPKAEMMMAFVAAPPPPPPPPPPPKAPEPARSAPTPVATSGTAAPVEPPKEVVAEAPPPTHVDDEDVDGVPGGMVGGVVGGLEPVLPLPPPPPPPPPAPRRSGPIRVGGQIKEPALLHRVDPVYPSVAVSANIEGTVILEAIVDEEGRVESVKVLRSMGVLDRPAVHAVQQWRYSPVLLNGVPEKFILTVAVTFRLEVAKR
jgi:protein TonB